MMNRYDVSDVDCILDIEFRSPVKQNWQRATTVLFRAIETYLLDHAAQRSMPHLTSFIDTLNVKRSLLTERFDNAPGYASNLVVLLSKILSDADVQTLLRKASDLDRYFDVLVFTAPTLNSIFDAVTTGLTFHDMAIRRSTVRAEEFFIPVSCIDPTTDLPFEQGWHAWKNIRALRLVDLDSRELTFATYQDMIVFMKQPPTRAIMTIDVVTLVLQYVTFLDSDEIPITQSEYLHRYVVTPLLQDLQDLWLSNIYKAMLERPTWFTDNPRQCVAELSGDQRYGFPGSELPSALKELSSFITSCRKGAIPPSVLLQNLPLSDCNTPTFLRRLLETTEVADRRQNYWMEYLRDIRWLMILYNAYQLQPDFAATRNLMTNLRRDIPILYGQRVWSNCHNPAVRQTIEEGLRDLMTKCG